jgi:5-methylcytosine-specific restriction protein A
MLDARHLSLILTQRHGVAITGDAWDDAEGQHVRFWPTALSQTRGFLIDVLIGWRSVTAGVTPGNYAAKLLSAMSQSTPDRRVAFGVFIRSSMNDGASVSFRINDAAIDPLLPAGWPGEWKSFSLNVHKGPFSIDAQNPETLAGLTLTWGGRVLCCALALLELEPVVHSGQAEGGVRQELVNRYERSASNRAACIELFGPRCKVCGFDFEAEFGDIGRGFIEIHHSEMVSRLQPGTVLDPAIDLVPLCANCHRMAHRRSHPFTVDELQAFRRHVKGPSEAS